MNRSVLLLSSVGAMALSSAVFAADLPSRVAAPVAPIMTMTTWTGFYAGLNLGIAFDHVTNTDVGVAGQTFATNGVAGQNFSHDDTNILGGGQVGYNYQMGQFVFGLEGDLGYLGVQGRALDPGTTSNTQVGLKGGLYGDVTGRLGIAFGNALAYVKGGWAFLDAKQDFSTTAAITGTSSLGTMSGWTLGGGLEYRLTRNISAKVEYQHFDFGRETFTVNPGGWPFREKLTADTVKVGINYLF